MAKVDCSNIGNIDNIGEDIISLWQKIICRGGQLAKKDIDMDYVQDDSNLASHHNSSTRVLEPIIDEIKMSEQHLTQV